MGTRFLIVTIQEGAVRWISQASTTRGAEMSKRNSMKRARFYKQYEVRILNVEEILAWDNRGLSELERLATL